MGPVDTASLEGRAINVIRGLAMDAPHAARSGHQGTAMALAPLAHVLYSRVMKFDPGDPEWPDRDRLVLSNGHASILLYSMLYLTGHGLELDDLRQFRQWESATPGHPEVGHTAGVEVTTGPLGQGFANAVGFALAERSLRARLGAAWCDHYTFAIVGDGCLSEGISHEAASLAGHQGLGRLIAIYDDNRITIDGATDLALSDDAVRRFESYGWHVIDLGERAEDCDAIEAALRDAMQVADRPSLVVLRSHIAYPSPDLVDKPAAHGYALFDAEIAAAKRAMNLPEQEQFYVPDDVLSWYRTNAARGRAERERWLARVGTEPREPALGEAWLRGIAPEHCADKLPVWNEGESIATRVASGKCIEALVDAVPTLVAGGADLTSNTGTAIGGQRAMSAADPGGRQLYFGVREHAMGAIMNGLALHKGVLPVGGTFLVFSDYMRPAVRLAALSRARVVYSFTHDSVGVGEDGPTHQPVEHVMSLRLIPGLRVIRPADANETAQAWRLALGADRPIALILSRQNLPVLAGTSIAGQLERGAYTLRDADRTPSLVLVGTGSEVAVCADAATELNAAGVPTRVVSMPSWDLFAEQPDAYRRAVLPPGVPALAVEAGVTMGWERYADAAVGIDRFGASAPGGEALKRLGISVGNVVQRAHELVAAQKSN